MMNIKRIITLLCLLMISLLVISACDSGSGRGGSLTVITPAEQSLSDIINGGVVIANDNGTITIVITNEDGEKEIVAYGYIDEESETIIIEVDGKIMGYIDEDGYIIDTDSNVIGYIDDDNTIVISIISNNTEEEADTSEEDSGNVKEENITITLDDDVLSAFAEEFITHFKAGGSSINSTDENVIVNVKYILTALANKGVDNVTSVGLASSFGRIVAEEVSDNETCNDEDLSLGCALANMMNSDNTLQSYFNMFLSQIGRLMFPSYYNTFTSIISNLANLNSQSENIESLTSILEIVANIQKTKKEEILNQVYYQIYYSANYMAYTTVKFYCNLSGINCGKSNTFFNIYTDEKNEYKITIGYCSGLYNSNGSCSNENTYILDQQVINDVESSASGWSTNNNYYTYIALYNNAGNVLKEACDNIIIYGNLYVNGYNANNSCSFTEGNGNTYSDAVSIANSIYTLTQAIYNNANNTPITYIANYLNTELSYLVEAITNVNTSDFMTSLTPYFYTALYTWTALVNANTIYDMYNSHNSGDLEVNDAGRKNIYYFITEFINGLDNEGEESYLSGYEFKDEYISKTLPGDMKSIESEKNDFYYNLSLAFTTETSGTAISVDTLNTTDDEKTSSTTGFTYASDILNNTKEYIIEVLEDYEVIVKDVKETENEEQESKD